MVLNVKLKILSGAQVRLQAAVGCLIRSCASTWSQSTQSYSVDLLLSCIFSAGSTISTTAHYEAMVARHFINLMRLSARSSFIAKSLLFFVFFFLFCLFFGLPRSGKKNEMQKT
jgi:hydrogenase maturation factor HypE